ncbi:hypothetical protein, partial [Catellatospora sp. NPDC049609]|uniref:hypothetical protein n=1 Tax=Catellatospora sp. NPDC049609 TaxID=3155505 RepID=UPI0034211616
MKTLRRTLSASAAALVLSVSMLPAPASASGGLHAVDLGTLTGTCCSVAYDINDQGVVVGASQVGTGENPPERAFRWRAGTMIDLGTLGGPSASAQAVNNNGWVVGYSMLADGVTTHAFLWRPGHGMTDLGSLGGDSIAVDVNDSGVVVGYYVDDAQLHGFRWANGVLTEITTTSGLPFVPSGINRYGMVSGTAEDQPATWKAGAVRLYGLTGAEGTAINDNGDVAAVTGYPYYVPFVWRASDMNEPLFTPAGTLFAGTSDLNEARHVVGWRQDAAGVRAVFWSPTGTPHLLPGLVPGAQSQAHAVNKHGPLPNDGLAIAQQDVAAQV